MPGAAVRMVEMPLQQEQREEHPEGEEAVAEDRHAEVLRGRDRGEADDRGQGADSHEVVHHVFSLGGRSSNRMRDAAPSRSSYWRVFSAQRKPARPSSPSVSAAGTRKTSAF